MNWKGHTFTGLIVFFILIFLDLYNGNNILPLLADKVGVLTILIGFVFYIVSLLLPDSDSKDCNSKIYHTPFFPVAYLCKLLEYYPLSKISSRPIGHRESLHTIFGISVTSLVITSVLAVILHSLKSFNLYSFLFLFMMLFLGQFIHLLCDLLGDLVKGSNGKWRIELI